MSYEANFNTALTYIRSGLTDRAVECLHKALAGVSLNEKNRDNVVYLRILTFLARLGIERGRRDEAMNYINEGLNLKDNHSDLLFLSSLYYFDEKRYDEMTGTLITYLVSLSQSDAAGYDYEFTGTGALKEVFERLIPASYSKAASHREIRDIISQLSEKTGDEMLKHAYKIMVEIDERRKAQNA